MSRVMLTCELRGGEVLELTLLLKAFEPRKQKTRGPLLSMGNPGLVLIGILKFHGL